MGAVIAGDSLALAAVRPCDDDCQQEYMNGIKARNNNRRETEQNSFPATHLYLGENLSYRSLNQ